MPRRVYASTRQTFQLLDAYGIHSEGTKSRNRHILTFDTVRLAAVLRSLLGSRYQFRDTGNASSSTVTYSKESDGRERVSREETNRTTTGWCDNGGAIAGKRRHEVTSCSLLTE